ncbi:MAG: sugar ABC transporter permease [Candidatus Vecturithrix sp.]|nr:sugar ABC transporter permease [Candidatus Vecturithrix sp.]
MARTVSIEQPRLQRRWRVQHDWPWMVAFVIPAFLVVVVVQLYPLAYSAFLAVQEWSLTSSQTPEGFNGVQNFVKMFGSDVFRRSVRNSFYITGGAIVIEMLLGMVLAYLTIGSGWLMRSVRTVLILPMVIAPVAAGTLWRMLLNSRAGLVNHLLGYIGIQGPEWLASPTWALISVMLLDIWQATPFVLLVVAAGITGIPGELLEAASIDGASRWQMFWKVELPLLTPLLLLTLMLRMLDSLLSLDAVYSLTFGGPGYSTYTLTFFIYTLGLRNFNLGLAAAASWMFMAFAAAVIALVFWLQRRLATS